MDDVATLLDQGIEVGVVTKLIKNSADLRDIAVNSQILLNRGIKVDLVNEWLGKIEQLPSSIILPARLAVEIEIGRAKAAALAGDIDEFINRFANGARGAKELGSDKRMQEAREAYMLARKRWPHEQRIIDLWELLI